MKLLLIEAEPNACVWLTERIAGEGFIPYVSGSAAVALCKATTATTIATVLDMGASATTAHQTVRYLRNGGLEGPLIVISGSGNWRDRVDSLDAGADDYVVKPVRVEEVGARLRAILRRTAGSGRNLITAGPIELDLKSRTAWLEGVPLELTRNDYRLLRLLMLNPSKVYSNQEISDLFYPQGEKRSSNAVEVRIARLRRKIGHKRIRTIRGVGYRFISGKCGGTLNGAKLANTISQMASESMEAWTPAI